MTVVIVTVVTVTVVIFVTLVIVTVATVAVGTVVIVTYFSKNNLTPQQQMRYSQGSFSRFSQCLVSISPKPCFRGVTKHNSDEVQNSELVGNTKSHRGKKCLITRICLILSDIPLPVFPGLVFIENYKKKMT